MVRWGMIGCGAVTKFKSAPAYSQVAGSRLVAVSSRRPETARDYAARNGIELVFDSAEDLIGCDHVDAVYIATPPSSHAHFAMLVAAAGKPCCVEKPMANCYAEAVDMVRAFETAQKPLFVAYYRRSLPRFRRVQEWIEEGSIGEVRHVHWTLMRPPSPHDIARDINWRTEPDHAPGGYFDDLASHGLDLFDFLAGPIAEAAGLVSNQQAYYNVPDAVAAAWRHSAGALGSGCWNFGAHQSYDRAMIVGSCGGIEFSVFEEAPLILNSRSGTTILEIPNPDPIQLCHVENIMRHLAGEGRHPSLGESAARTARVMDRILSDAVPISNPSC